MADSLLYVYSYNPRFCPNPYCVCASPTTSIISATNSSWNLVHVYAATTTGGAVCPTVASETGCEIVVQPTSNTTCGSVVYNTKFCQSSPTSSPNSASIQVLNGTQISSTARKESTSSLASVQVLNIRHKGPLLHNRNKYQEKQYQPRPHPLHPRLQHRHWTPRHHHQSHLPAGP